jgi:hypothetical protein
MPANLAALHEGLKAVGLEEGRNIRIEDRWPGIDAEMTRAFARELIALKPDAIVARSPSPAGRKSSGTWWHSPKRDLKEGSWLHLTR